jgi:hypothetical protein
VSTGVGDTPAAAIADLLAPLQRALSCVSSRVLAATGWHPEGAPFTVLPAGPEFVRLGAAAPLSLRLGLRYELEPPTARAGWRAPVTSYFYVLENGEGREIFAFHLHPAGTSTTRWPHLHVGPGTGAQEPHTAAHLPTGGPVTLAEVFRLCVLDLGVRTRRGDWRKVLDADG